MIELINNISVGWMAFFSSAVIQDSIFLGIIFFIFYLLRNRNAKLQYSIGLFGLIKLILPPFVPLQIEKPLNAVWLMPENLTPGLLDVNFSESALSGSAALTWTGAGFVIWLAGVLFILSAVMFSFARLSRSLRNGKSAGTAKIGRRRIGIVLQSSIHIPLSFGVFPKNIYMPSSWLSWPPGLKRLVLDHELAHIKRYDGLVQLIQTIVLALFWFNPLVWLLVHKLDILREMICDDISVSANKTEPVLYSRYLVKIAEEMVRSKVSIYSFSALIRKKSSLLKRVEYQMKEKKMKSLSSKRVGIIFAVILFAGLALSWNLIKTGSVEINILDTHNVEVNGKKAAFEDLKGVLAELIVDKVDERIYIKSDNNVMMGTVEKVYDTLRELKLHRIHYPQGDPNYGSNFVLPPKNNPEILKKISKKNILNIDINAAGGVANGNNQFSNLQLTQLVKTKLKQNPNLIVSVLIDKKCRYNDYSQVINSLRKADARRISIGYN